MSRPRISLVYVGAAGVVLMLSSFLVFATAATRLPLPLPAKGDAIVVLTGGSEHRIATAVRLLREGWGRRLLISGVNRKARPDEVLARSGTGPVCCIDFGYDALDTIGNATETRDWAATNGFERLIVVTSSYHMPRTLVEFSRAMPDVQFVAHPVLSRNVRDHAWWQSPGTLRFLFGEYVKFIAAATRLGLSRAHALIGDGGRETVTTAR